ncbi:MAG: helix-turn-helix domain-containing protein [Gemmatimonadetes bacterium]|nr:helix-turn-helix domain-containing protein [Gemmatimonadota bacterium]
METLRREHGFSDVEWRAELARGVVGSPPRVAGTHGDGAGGGSGRSNGGPEILSVDDAADYLGVHSQTVRNYIRSGKLPAYRLAGERYIRVLRKDLLALLERVQTDVSEENEEKT